MATARKILRIAFATLRDGEPYRDPQIDYAAQTARKNAQERTKVRWLKMSQRANLLQEVAGAAAEQAGARPRAGADPSGPMPHGPDPWWAAIAFPKVSRARDTRPPSGRRR